VIAGPFAKKDTMLVLRRKVGERIIIGDSIEVTVLRVRGGKVQLGFTAPASVRVMRQEALGPRAPAALQAEPVAETFQRREATLSRDGTRRIKIDGAQGSETPQVAVGSSRGEEEEPTEVDCACGPRLHESSQEEISPAPIGRGGSLVSGVS